MVSLWNTDFMSCGYIYSAVLLLDNRLGTVILFSRGKQYKGIGLLKWHPANVYFCMFYTMHKLQELFMASYRAPCPFYYVKTQGKYSPY